MMIIIGWLYILPVILPYSTTFLGRPGFTGSRSWHAFRTHRLWAWVERYFQARIVDDAKLIQGQRYLFCFGPHGSISIISSQQALVALSAARRMSHD